MIKDFKEFSQDLNKKIVDIELSSALHLGKLLDVDFNKIPIEQFIKGIAVEAEEHPDVTKGNVLVAAQIALAHLKELPDYYDRLEKIEKK